VRACLQVYQWGDKTIPVDVDTHLTLDGEGRVAKHVDTWVGSTKPPDLVRRFMGDASTLAMQAAGAS
jgi:hypothetical protein